MRNNLENYGVQEKSIQEVKSIDGGFWQFVVGALYDIVKAGVIVTLEGYIKIHQR